ncbi:mitochondrial inner membrane protein Mpv17 isoform X2 [Sebastes fasciatus]|uniref:mitochondrial inner membrane protein Mpv17 isoform X2 n=1 Tax=Sebastes fasciatus TaxID=394691 RepID=UPI003D9F771D
MARLWRSYQMLLTRYPQTGQTLTAGCLMGVGDVVSQQLVERKGLTHHDLKQTTKMMSIGFILVGPVLGSWYKILDRLVVGGTKSAAMKKMLLDQLGFAPVLLGVFHGFYGVLSGLTVEENVAKVKRSYLSVCCQLLKRPPPPFAAGHINYLQKEARWS